MSLRISSNPDYRARRHILNKLALFFQSAVHPSTRGEEAQLHRDSQRQNRSARLLFLWVRWQVEVEAHLAQKLRLLSRDQGLGFLPGLSRTLRGSCREQNAPDSAA